MLPPSPFARVVVIGLRRRPERLAAFLGDLRAIEGGWPFAPAQVFDAYDGDRVPAPDGQQEGPHVAACLASHTAVLRRAISDGIGSVLVLEDDATFRPTFRDDVERFLAAVPDDWNGLWLGNENLGGYGVVVPDLVIAPHQAHRMHAYALRGRGLIDGYRCLASAVTGHADHVLGEFFRQGDYRIYASFPPALVGQRAGFSDLMRASHPDRFW